ncbi:gamma-glutamyltransferase family protein [Streptomyces sp. BBFR51]|uniref:gamma-glutamyltransferase family protein n=1 Tax=Streptomyces sp. BBFR51 TaxID=3372856 RepID=UPI0037DCAC87
MSSVQRPSGRPGLGLASPHGLATHAGKCVVEQGGNAVDAAVAAAITLSVVYPHQCGVGGDLMALVAVPDGRVLAVNATGAAPAGVVLGDLATVGSMPSRGPDTVTVPGAAAGWATLSRLAGRLPFPRLFDFAVACATEGVPVSPGLAHVLSHGQELLGRDPGMRAVFYPDGVPPAVNSVLTQPALARTLAAIAETHASALYSGDVGKALVAFLRGHGAALSTWDLTRHDTEITAPIGRVFGGEEYLTAPPNSQGVHLLQILGALDVHSSVSDPFDSAAKVCARVFQAAADDRAAYLADPRCAPVDIEYLLSDKRIAELSCDAPQLSPRITSAPRSTGDTAAVVSADDEGYAVSLIQSLFQSFGSGLLDAATGIVAHNRGSAFSLDPTSPNYLQGGKRPAHTLLPVITRSGGEITGAHGTMGGLAQPQIHAQFAAYLRAGMDAADVLHRPRWAVTGRTPGDLTGTIVAEHEVPAETVDTLGSAGFPVVRRNDDAVGHGQIVRRRPDGFSAAADPRSDGAAVTLILRDGWESHDYQAPDRRVSSEVTDRAELPKSHEISSTEEIWRRQGRIIEEYPS